MRFYDWNYFKTIFNSRHSKVQMWIFQSFPAKYLHPNKCLKIFGLKFIFIIFMRFSYWPNIYKTPTTVQLRHHAKLWTIRNKRQTLAKKYSKFQYPNNKTRARTNKNIAEMFIIYYGEKRRPEILLGDRQSRTRTSSCGLFLIIIRRNHLQTSSGNNRE